MDLQAFAPLIGDWTTEGVMRADGGGEPPRGRTSFAWLVRGGYLIQHAAMDNPVFPVGVMVIGPTADGSRIVQHYFDSRGVARVYETSLEDGVWRLWRDGSFAQRFTGRIEGARIEGAWEKDEGAGWVHDFDLVYTRT